MSETRILIVDDHQMMREGLRRLLEEQSDLLVVAEAENGREAVQLTHEHPIDLVVMDVNMPEMNGIEATRHILKKHPEIKILCLSMYSNKRFLQDILQAGASGYILKECAFKELIEAIDTVNRGETYLCTKVTRLFVKHFMQPQGTSSTSDVSLSNREHEVLRMISEGKSTKEIAMHIHMSGKTVDACRRQIMQKLGIHSTAGLVKYAIREGITNIAEV